MKLPILFGGMLEVSDTIGLTGIWYSGRQRGPSFLSLGREPAAPRRAAPKSGPSSHPKKGIQIHM